MMDAILTYSPLFYAIQSFWRDEAYSVLFAQMPVKSIIALSQAEPPVYYVLLHFWTSVFGTGDVMSRMLSLFAFLLAAAAVIFWSERLFRNHFLSWVTPIIFFLNPMLQYYAFEARAYAWYVLFTVASLFSYAEKNVLLFTVFSILGFYTHLYFIFVPVALGLHYLFWNRSLLRHPARLLHDPMVRSLAVFAVATLPWFYRLYTLSGKFAQTWYFPVDFRLVSAVLGNMLVGYEGTPWFLWGLTTKLSLLIVAAAGLALIPKENRKEASMFLAVVAVPLVLVLGISAIKPVYVNRYLIPVTVAEIFLICYAIRAIRSAPVRVFFTVSVIALSAFFDCWYPVQHKKTDLRGPVTEAQMQMRPGDVLLAADPLVFPETLFYAADKSRVFLYNPSGASVPWYIGESLFSPARVKTELPQYPARAFLIDRDGSYRIEFAVPARGSQLPTP